MEDCAEGLAAAEVLAAEDAGDVGLVSDSNLREECREVFVCMGF